jgi:porin
VRVAVKPNDGWSLMLGVYNGDPAGAHCTGNPQVCDDNGLDFRFDSPPLLIAEGSYKYNQEGHLPGAIKIGGWNQFGTLHNQPFSSGSPTVAVTFDSVPIKSDWAIYGIIDQLLWRVPYSKDPKGIGLSEIVAASAHSKAGSGTTLANLRFVPLRDVGRSL